MQHMNSKSIATALCVIVSLALSCATYAQADARRTINTGRGDTSDVKSTESETARLVRHAAIYEQRPSVREELIAIYRELTGGAPITIAISSELSGETSGDQVPKLLQQAIEAEDAEVNPSLKQRLAKVLQLALAAPVTVALPVTSSEESERDDQSGSAIHRELEFTAQRFDSFQSDVLEQNESKNNNSVTLPSSQPQTEATKLPMTSDDPTKTEQDGSQLEPDTEKSEEKAEDSKDKTYEADSENSGNETSASQRNRTSENDVQSSSSASRNASSTVAGLVLQAAIHENRPAVREGLVALYRTLVGEDVAGATVTVIPSASVSIGISPLQVPKLLNQAIDIETDLALKQQLETLRQLALVVPANSKSQVTGSDIKEREDRSGSITHGELAHKLSAFDDYLLATQRRNQQARNARAAKQGQVDQAASQADQVAKGNQPNSDASTQKNSDGKSGSSTVSLASPGLGGQSTIAQTNTPSLPTVPWKNSQNKQGGNQTDGNVWDPLKPPSSSQSTSKPAIPSPSTSMGGIETSEQIIEDDVARFLREAIEAETDPVRKAELQSQYDAYIKNL